MATTLTPNMMLPVPIVGQEIGPQWAIDINNCLSLLDGHSHLPGSGVQITPLAININADLTFANNNAIGIRALRFNSQGSAPSTPADIGELTEIGNDLYFIDGLGNVIRITQSGGIVGTPGSITGLVSPASASYNSITSTFIFQSNVNTAANADISSLILRKSTASSPGLTLQVPSAISSNYTLVLPALPSVPSLMLLDTSGNITASITPDNSTLVISGSTLEVQNGGITQAQLAALSVGNAQLQNDSVQTVQILDGSVTIPKLAGANISSSGSFTFSSSSTSFVDVTGASVAIVSSGRPIICFLQPADASAAATIALNQSTSVGNVFQIARNGAPLLQYAIPNAPTSGLVNSAPSSIYFIDTPSAAGYTYKLQVKVGTSNSISLTNCRMIVYELG